MLSAQNLTRLSSSVSISWWLNLSLSSNIRNSISPPQCLTSPVADYRAQNNALSAYDIANLPGRKWLPIFSVLPNFESRGILSCHNFTGQRSQLCLNGTSRAIAVCQVDRPTDPLHRPPFYKYYILSFIARTACCKISHIPYRNRHRARFSEKLH